MRNMEEKRNAYEIIGTNKIVIDRIKDEQEKNRFIQEKAIETTKRIYRNIDVVKEKLNKTQSFQERILLDRRKKELEEEIEFVQSAYEKIFDKEHREKYNAFLSIVDQSKSIMRDSNSNEDQENPEPLISDELLEEIKNKIKNNRPKKETAYEILQTSQEQCNDKKKKTEKIDADLKEKKDGFIELAKVEFEKKVKNDKKNEFAAKQRLKVDIARIEEAYREIATKTKRESYNQKLADIERKEQKAIEDEILRMKYDRSKNYEPSSIVTLKYQENKSKLPGVIISRDNGQEILIQNIGRIAYEDSFGIKDEIGEYEITQIIKGEEKTDKVYISGLNLLALSKDEQTGAFQNEEYYKFIANEMLSDEAIEQCSKYNKGYLGEPLKDKNGEYFRFLDGREELSAVMKFDEELNKEKGQENQFKIEGDERE